MRKTYYDSKNTIFRVILVVLSDTEILSIIKIMKNLKFKRV